MTADRLTITMSHAERDTLLALINTRRDALVSRWMATGDKAVIIAIRAEREALELLAMSLELAEFRTPAAL